MKIRGKSIAGMRIIGIGFLVMVFVVMVAGITVQAEPLEKEMAASETETGADLKVNPDMLTINIHYQRYNEDYEDWTLWLWNEGSDGKEYPFTSGIVEGFVSTQVVLENVSENDSVGTLIKYKDWEQKDVNKDRFLDLSKAKSGILNVYFLQGEEEIYYSAEEINGGKRVVRACYDDVNEISFSLYYPGITEADLLNLSVLMEEEGGESYPLTNLEMSIEGNVVSGNGIIEKNVELAKCNYLVIEGMEKRTIEAGNVFSSKAFEDAYYYEGEDLGATYSKEATAFRVWAPTASKVEVNLYETGNGRDLIKSYEMKPSEKGTWYLDLEGDYNRVYYTYSVTVHGETNEAVDPYAKACGVNGMRGMILNLSETDPEGFLEEVKPELQSFSDIILYEMSVRDYTVDESSGVNHKGKYLGLTEEGCVNSEGESTGLDYLGNLGITHIHLLPSQDFGGVDEEHPADSYNWGYGTENFNVPEGSYSTDPYNGEVRINEYKQMVHSLHKKGIRIVMDVVYNHTYDTEESNFSKIVPGYYYRMTEDGSYSNGSACGNEVASERAMVRKFIVDSVTYWAKEYHVDGFRFDLMGLIDIETMNQVRSALNEIDKTIYIYGEGWNAGDSVYEETTAVSEKAGEMPGIAVFSNVFRRGIQKYVSGIFEEQASKNSVLFGVVAATKQEITKDSMGSWTKDPIQCINYASCHDGFTLWDLIRQNCPAEDEEMWKKRNKLSAAIVMTCQGVPFIQSGEELLRTKVSEKDPNRIYSNSYNSGDYVNSIKWDTITENLDMIVYYKGLMAFRKIHTGLSYETTDEITENMKFLNNLEENVLGYIVTEEKDAISNHEICMIYNPNSFETNVTLPEGTWEVYINGEQAGTESIETIEGAKEITVPEAEALVLVRSYVKPQVIYMTISFGAVLILFILLGVHGKRKEKGRDEHSSNH